MPTTILFAGLDGVLSSVTRPVIVARSLRQIAPSEVIIVIAGAGSFAGSDLDNTISTRDVSKIICESSEDNVRP